MTTKADCQQILKEWVEGGDKLVVTGFRDDVEKGVITMLVAKNEMDIKLVSYMRPGSYYANGAPNGDILIEYTFEQKWSS